VTIAYSFFALPVAPAALVATLGAIRIRFLQPQLKNRPESAQGNESKQ
jgi:hypothetical protein